MSAAIALTIADVNVSQDERGRFSLNDLHRASGAKRAHQPSNWLRTDQTQRLIAELAKGAEEHLSTAPNPQIRGFDEFNVEPISLRSGNAGGTFVVRELVYAYAMWISAPFHLKVIRAYDAMMRLGMGANAKRSALNVTTAVRLRASLIGLIHKCVDAGVARGYHRCLQVVDSELGMESEALEDIAPHLRQQRLSGV